MSASLSLPSLLNDVRLETPALSRHLQNAIQAELDANSKHFPLQEGWRRLRGRFAADFEAALLPLIQTAGAIETAQQQSLRNSSTETLSLVDERQALQDVALAHVIQAIEDRSGPELHQLSNFFAALRGTAKARKNENPVRAALFAQALMIAFSSIELEPQQRYDLMRVAATPLAQGLHRVYAALCARLRAAELSQMVSSHAARAQDHDITQRIAQGRRNTAPATLDGLAKLVQAHNTRPAGLAMPAAGAPTQFFKPAPGPDLLGRLYEQILADPRLLPAMKALLARLQVAVVRLAQHDSSLLHKQDHPAWALLNRVAAHGMAFERPDDERLQSFLRFIGDATQSLIETPNPVAQQFRQVLTDVEAQLNSQALQRSERSQMALAALEREQMRTQWQHLLCEQIKAQTAGAPLGPKLRQFLNSSWVEVIVQAMVLHGESSDQAMSNIEWVDRLLASLQAPGDSRAQQALRLALPELIQQLRTGCDAIALSGAQREAVLLELMQQHGRILRGLPGLESPQTAPTSAFPTISDLPEPSSDYASTAAASLEPSPEELFQRLLAERESELPEHWAHARVDRGQLATVPMQLFDQHDANASQAAISNWMARQQVGNWYHLFIQSEWLTAQLSWVSSKQQYYLFVGQDADLRHSLTRGAVEQLLANGLITALDDDNLIQHAVDTLMQDLQGQS
jgi:hypothetical protein